MRNRLQHLRRDERGMSLVFVGMGFMAFLAATTLAIDVGMFMTARSQAQNAADAGAHAGAVALAFDSFTDRSSSGPAVQSALKAARANTIVGQMPSITSGDVTFPLGPSGENDRVKVVVYRDTAHESAVPTLLGSIFGVNTVNISATATAEASPADAETCVMPFTIPDRWDEKQDPGGFDPNNSTFDVYTNKGQPLANPDVYVAPGNQGATGYTVERDLGLQLVLKNNNQSKTAPSFYNPWDLPGSSGGSDYRNNIANCNTHIVQMGDPLPAEPGNMVGPTKQGTDDLIAKDPNAHWDTSCNCVKNSAFAKSPRVAIIPLYDPYKYEEGKHNGSNASLYMANFLGFFIEEIRANGQVTGRITPIGGLVSGNGGPAIGAFPKAIRIIQ